jgi:hypothetical protein
MLESLHPYLLPIHVTTVFGLVGLVLLADVVGFRWIRGIEATLDPKKLSRLHTSVWCGLAVMVVSGFFMFWPYREYLLFEMTFRIKMLFVLTLIVNGFFIGRLMHVAITLPFADLPADDKKKLFISGGISTLSWAGAITCGLLINL